jgi:hypothetical protein
MGLPPRVTGNDFDLDVTDPDEVINIKALTQEVKEAIFRLRVTVLIKGTLANDLMELHRNVSNETEITAQFEAHAHPRNLGANIKCRSQKKNDCVRFAVIKMIHYLQDVKKGLIDIKQLKGQIAAVNAIGAHQYENFRVSGSDRVGYHLILKKGQGLGG